MGAIENYKIAIVKRTKEILQNYYPTFEQEDREVTFLMNCLLGLIIAITEAEKIDEKILRGKIDEKFIRNIPDKVGFIQLKIIDLDLVDKD
jgi:outer membrane protein assembly factor BamD (BamD/ComL family)